LIRRGKLLPQLGFIKGGDKEGEDDNEEEKYVESFGEKKD
jgi:hypothetical protein